jgi:hypothetical protein
MGCGCELEASGMEWFFAFLGIPIAIVATRLDVALMWAVNRVRFGRMEITGNWAEYVATQPTRQYSLATIEYDLIHRRYNLDGTNYNNDGSPHCYFRTVSSHLDREELQFHYVFETRELSAMHIKSYGYGVVNLARTGNRISPVDGYYVYVTPEGEPVAVSHSLKRADGQPPRNVNAGAYFDAIFPAERLTGLQPGGPAS